MENHTLCKINIQNKGEVAILISDKIDFKMGVFLKLEKDT